MMLFGGGTDFEAVKELAVAQLYERVQSFIPSNITVPDFIDMVQATVVIMLLVSFFFSAYIIIKDEARENKIYNLKPKKQKKAGFIRDILLKELADNMIIINKEKGKDERAGVKQFNMLLMVTVGVSIFMVAVKQYFFALVMPIILLIAMTKVTGMIKTGFDEYVQRQLPGAIDNMIRVLTKTGDMRLVMYETSQMLESPMKEFFSDMSMRMLNESPSSVIRDVQSRATNIWIHNLLFILISMEEDARKEDVVMNLRQLRDIVDRDNKTRKSEQAERKLTVAVNYTLCGFAFVAFIANVIFNPKGIPFFFGSIIGIGCFTAGMALLTMSIFTNLLLTRGK